MIINDFLEDVRGNETSALGERFFLLEATVDVFPFVGKLLSKVFHVHTGLWPHAQRSRGASIVLKHGLRCMHLRTIIQLVVIAQVNCAPLRPAVFKGRAQGQLSVQLIGVGVFLLEARRG